MGRNVRKEKFKDCSRCFTPSVIKSLSICTWINIAIVLAYARATYHSRYLLNLYGI